MYATAKWCWLQRNNVVPPSLCAYNPLKFKLHIPDYCSQPAALSAFFLHPSRYIERWRAKWIWSQWCISECTNAVIVGCGGKVQEWCKRQSSDSSLSFGYLSKRGSSWPITCAYSPSIFKQLRDWFPHWNWLPSDVFRQEVAEWCSSLVIKNDSNPLLNHPPMTGY